MTKFILKETYIYEDHGKNESATELYYDFVDAKIAFRRLKRFWQKNHRSSRVVELAPTYIALYNFLGKLIYTCEILIEPSNEINEI